MGRYRELERHLGQLRELEEIIGSMKTLAMLELHKLGRLASGGTGALAALERSGADFLRHYPQPDTHGGPTLWVVLGSERGFCGDFNHLLAEAVREGIASGDAVLALGRKLWIRLEDSLGAYTPVAGAGVSEELPGTLRELVVEVRRLFETGPYTRVRLIHHHGEVGKVNQRQLLPFAVSESEEGEAVAPLLQLSPEQFLAGFLAEYLLMALNEALVFSLMAENQFRVQHLDGAVRRLDERLEKMGARARTLRQEEITEEIEVILLGAEQGGPPKLR